MPRRPAQHQISDRAVAKVREVWASIGAAVEEIRRDYGEDLLVQTCLDGKMDAARIWVQVKGVTNAPKMRASGETQVRVRADLALRWSRTADILVLVLWDINNDIGWYAIPTRTELHAELAGLGRAMVGLPIDSANRFNSESAQVVAWEARMEHLAGFIRNFRGMQEEDYDDNDPDRGLWATAAIAEAVLEMMASLNMINLTLHRDLRAATINPDFKTSVLDNAEEMGSAAPDEAEDYVDYLLLSSLLKQIEKEAACGVSVAVLAEMAPIVYAMLDLDKLATFIRNRKPSEIDNLPVGSWRRRFEVDKHPGDNTDLVNWARGAWRLRGAGPGLSQLTEKELAEREEFEGHEANPD
jgi:hypothetical protein